MLLKIKIPARIKCMHRYQSLVPWPCLAFQHSGDGFSAHAPTKPQEHV